MGSNSVCCSKKNNGVCLHHLKQVNNGKNCKVPSTQPTFLQRLALHNIYLTSSGLVEVSKWKYIKYPNEFGKGMDSPNWCQLVWGKLEFYWILARHSGMYKPLLRLESAHI